MLLLSTDHVKRAHNYMSITSITSIGPLFNKKNRETDKVWNKSAASIIKSANWLRQYTSIVIEQHIIYSRRETNEQAEREEGKTKPNTKQAHTYSMHSATLICPDLPLSGAQLQGYSSTLWQQLCLNDKAVLVFTDINRWATELQNHFNCLSMMSVIKLAQLLQLTAFLHFYLISVYVSLSIYYVCT